MLHYANFSSCDQSLNHSKLALISRLLADEIEESSVYVLRQVGSLQRATLRLESQSRALPGDGTAAVSDVSKQLIGAHVVLVIPKLVKVSHTVGQESCQRASQCVTLATGSLQATLTTGNDGVFTVRDVIDRPFLDDSHATEGIGQLGAQLVLLLGVDINVLTLRQAAELDHVRRENAVLVSVHQVWASLGKVQSVGVEDECNTLLPGFSKDASAGLLHGRVATETRADDNHMETVQHGDDILGDRVDGFVLAHVLLLAHVGVHHEVGRVGLDDCSSGGLADNVGLRMMSAPVWNEGDGAHQSCYEA